MTPTSIAAYLALFVGAGFIFLFVNLLVGWFLRPRAPNKEKLEVYECGEPTIGSSFVQFDLRFYVVALLFIIFDVEVAFFFPWATVFGKAAHLQDRDLPRVAVSESTGTYELRPEATHLYRELGIPKPTLENVIGKSPGGSPRTKDESVAAVAAGARQIALLSFVDIIVFFFVLMVGFFYVWRRGDLDWVRAVSQRRSGQLGQAATTRPEPRQPEPVLVS
jgi:NADH-quinone oxidoreductase subunit A